MGQTDAWGSVIWLVGRCRYMAGLGMGGCGQVWVDMGKGGQVWMGQTDQAGMGDMGSWWVCVCMLV